MGGQSVVPRAKSSTFCGTLALFSGTEIVEAQVLR